MTVWGVNYDTGTNYSGTTREVWREDLIRHEIRAIRDDLHATAVNVYGSDVDRLRQVAAIAREDGLDVWLQPRNINAGPLETVAFMTAAARVAEDLRRTYGGITFNVGCELTIFADGLMPGPTFEERGARLATVKGWPFLPVYNRRLNKLLKEMVNQARSTFDGPITYGAGIWERVDWAPFDIVGLDYYRLKFNQRGYAKKLTTFTKPVAIVEFGCGAFEGAADVGPTAHEFIDYSTPVPEIKGGKRRDEREQADLLTELIGIYGAAGVAAAFVFEFIEPAHPHTTDPRFDLDMAGYSLVKVFPDGDAYRWEPKESFHAVANLFSASGSTGTRSRPASAA